MSKSLTLRTWHQVYWKYEETSDEISDPVDETTFRLLTQFTSGTGSNQVNRMYRARRTVTLNSTTEQLDLSGSLLDKFGDSVLMMEIKVLLIINRGAPDGSGGWTTTAGQDILVGGAGVASLAWGAPFNGDQNAKLRVRSGGALLLVAPVDGYRVDPGVQDVLQIEHDGSAASGGDIEYDIVIAGVGG